MAKEDTTDGEYHAETSAKQGHIICGLCDTRRAVIGLDSMIILFYLTCLVFYGWQSALEFSEDFDGIDSVTQNHWIVIAALVIGVICTIGGIYGALRFNSILAYIAAGWFSVNVVWNIVQWDVVGALIMAAFAYPHIYFYQELNEDIMSKEKYQNEVYSCCCV